MIYLPTFVAGTVVGDLVEQGAVLSVALGFKISQRDKP